MKEKPQHGGKRPGSGRPPSQDPRQPLPFRLKASVIQKARALGRERLEALVESQPLAEDDALCYAIADIIKDQASDGSTACARSILAHIDHMNTQADQPEA